MFHLRGQRRHDIGDVKVGGGQDCRMNKPGIAERVGEKPLIGEKERDRLGEHGEGADFLSLEPSKANLASLKNHEKLQP